MRDIFEFKGYRARVVYDAEQGAFVYLHEVDPALAAIGFADYEPGRSSHLAAGKTPETDQAVDASLTHLSISR